MDSFVRYDLLTEETYQSMENRIKNNKNRIKRLETLNTNRGSKKSKNKEKRIRFSIELKDE